MIKVLKYLACLLTIAACTKPPVHPEPRWLHTTKVADKYLYKIMRADANGENLFGEVTIDADRNLETVKWQDGLNLLFNEIKKDDIGRVASVTYTNMLGNKGTYSFGYDGQDRIITKNNTYTDSVTRILTTTYEYDAPGRLARIVDPTFHINYYYTGSSNNPDSIVSTYRFGPATRYTTVYTYDTNKSPFETLPDLLVHLHTDIYHMYHSNTITSQSIFVDGIKQKATSFTCKYNAEGLLTEKVSDQGYTLRYYYK